MEAHGDGSGEQEAARVEAGDVPGMVAAIRRLWEDRDGCLSLGARTRELARRYDWEASGDAVLGLYRTLLPGVPELAEAVS